METNHTPSNFEKKVLSNLVLPSGLPKEEVWERMQETLHATPPKNPIRTLLIRCTVAATLAIGIVGGFLRHYQTTIHCPPGSYQAAILPDGSQVYLNAGSSLSYAPYWWNRTVALTGEAFFEVTKGSRFVVESAQGQTEVLGTSFNVYARKQNYVVVCKTGKVLVTTAHRDSVYLLPEEKAILVQDQLQKEKPQRQELAWREQSFHFEEAPLLEVLQELERQYAIQITLSKALVKKYYYTGYFKKTEKPTDALEIITISLGLTFKKTAARKYTIRS
ncbi:MAG: FecR family protein [Aureispira sp.]